jgi:hypothetical protein
VNNLELVDMTGFFASRRMTLGEFAVFSVAAGFSLRFPRQKGFGAS